MTRLYKSKQSDKHLFGEINFGVPFEYAITEQTTDFFFAVIYVGVDLSVIQIQLEY